MLLKGSIEDSCCKNQHKDTLQTKFFWCNWPLSQLVQLANWPFSGAMAICNWQIWPLSLTSFNPSWVPPPPCFPLPTSAPDLLIASHLASNHNLSILIWEPVKYCKYLRTSQIFQFSFGKQSNIAITIFEGPTCSWLMQSKLSPPQPFPSLSYSLSLTHVGFKLIQAAPFRGLLGHTSKIQLLVEYFVLPRREAVCYWCVACF